MNVNQSVFLDSNLLVYAHTNIEPIKQLKIQQIIIEQNTIISTQVFKETANVLHRKFKFEWSDIQSVLKEMEQNNEIYTNTTQTVQLACSIANRYHFSFYDSLIIAAALEAQCSILYSEDMQHNQVTEQSLTIKNPFL